MVKNSKLNYPKQIKVVAVDMDQTLYPKSPEIDQAIQTQICHLVAEYKDCDFNTAEELFRKHYQIKKSGTRALIAMDIQKDDAKNMVQTALEKADINRFLSHDQVRLNLLIDLRKHFYSGLDLITGSNLVITLNRLDKLHINRIIFDYLICRNCLTNVGATMTEWIDLSKSDGSAFRAWLKLYPQFKPNQFLYIGDDVDRDHLIPSRLGIQTILVNVEKDNSVECPQLATFNELRGWII